MKEEIQIDKLSSPTSLEIYHCGPDLTQGPLPSLIYFALSGPESLTVDPFNQPITFLHKEPIRKFSFTLPFHGPGFSNTKAMELWANELSVNNDFLTPFFDRIITNISFLIEEGYIDIKHIAAAGLSRGGFIATHLAAMDERIGSILGFAPITQFGWMRDYEEKSVNCMARKFDLSNAIDKLIGRPLRYYIGNRDHRVGTHACFRFISELAEASFQHGDRSPKVELIISPSIGHKGHGTSPHTFKEGAEWIKGKLQI